MKADMVIALGSQGSLSTFIEYFRNTAFTNDEVTAGLTLFAPADSAFANKVAISGNNQIFPDSSVVKDYFAKGKITPDQLKAGLTVTMLSGKTYTVTAQGGALYLNNILISGQGTPTGNNALLYTLGGLLNKDKFPAITRLSDSKTLPGWVLTIEGSNFGATPADNEVEFSGGVKALIHTSTATKLEVTVPDGATTGKLMLRIKGKAATSPQDIGILTARTATLNAVTALNCGPILGIAADSDDNLYFSDSSRQRLIRYSKTGQTTIFQPTMQANYDVNGDGIIDSRDRIYALTTPRAVAVDAQNNAYVSNYLSYWGIYKIDIRDDTKSGWWAGNATATPFPVGNKSQISIAAACMQLDASGNMLLGSAFPGVGVQRIMASGSVSIAAAPNVFKSADPNVLRDPVLQGITADGNGNTYFSDPFNLRIWKLGADGIIMLAGNNNQPAKDGIGGAAQFGVPAGIATDKKGNVYVCDNDQVNRIFLIRVINRFGVVTTISGSRNTGLADTDGNGKNAQYNGVSSITTDSKGVFYIGTNSGRIRTLSLE